MAYPFTMRHTLPFVEELKMHSPPAEVAHKSARQKWKRLLLLVIVPLLALYLAVLGLFQGTRAKMGTLRPREFLTFCRGTKVPFALL